MRQLTVYHEPSSNDEPHILSFQDHVAQIRRSNFRVVRHEEPGPETREILQTFLANKARLRHHNSCCPECHRVTIEPVEMHDALVTRSGAIVRGSATIVGFSCSACGHEWSV